MVKVKKYFINASRTQLIIILLWTLTDQCFSDSNKDSRIAILSSPLSFCVSRKLQERKDG